MSTAGRRGVFTAASVIGITATVSANGIAANIRLIFFIRKLLFRYVLVYFCSYYTIFSIKFLLILPITTSPKFRLEHGKKGKYFQASQNHEDTAGKLADWRKYRE